MARSAIQVSLNNQFLTLGLMIGCGGWIGLIFDVYRVLSGQLRVPRWLLPLFDIAYWLFATIVVFRVLYYSNHGQLRFFVFLGLLGGIAVYYKWVSRFVIRQILLLIRGFKWLFRLLKRIIELLIVTPILAIYKLILLFLGFFKAFAVFLFRIMLQSTYPLRFLLLPVRNLIRDRLKWPLWIVKLVRKLVRVIRRLLKLF